MRLFKCEDQVGRKSILSNQSIIPCSEDSFISSGVNKGDAATNDPQSNSFAATNTNTAEQPAKQAAAASQEHSLPVVTLTASQPQLHKQQSQK